MTDQARKPHEFECPVCHGETQLVKVGAFHVCNDPRCADVAKAWGGTFPHDDVCTLMEKEATEYAASEAGRFLDAEYGKTDLASLTRAQYLAYASYLVLAYRCRLRELGKDVVPF